MPLRLDSISAFLDAPFDTIIDARSPAEFAEDHVSGAISLPVLTDEERAQVGEIYAGDSFAARKIGAALVARNVAAHLEGPLAEKGGGWRPLVYCWRGGQRSGAFATILRQVGWRAETVEGGYRAYRRLIAAAMHERPLPHRLVLLDGNTGTAKTEILARVAALGEQVVDLEGLASHRGSVFGAAGRPQPSQKAFEGALAAALDAFDPSRAVLVEAESSKIGRLQVPPSVWARMLGADRFVVEAGLDARANYLARTYSDLTADSAELNRTLELLRPLQGAARVSEWRTLADEGRFEALAAALMSTHYDPRYAKSRPEGDVVLRVELGDMSEAALESATCRIAKALALRGKSAETPSREDVEPPNWPVDRIMRQDRES